MEDRFKFRVPFYKYDNTFAEFEYTDFIKGLSAYNAGVVYRKEFEQCTGLNDCNGKLIYKGDIIRTEIETDNEYKQIIGEIVFWRLEWTIKTKSVFYPLSCAGKFSNGRKMPKQCDLTEVIGNIHENPELLER